MIIDLSDDQMNHLRGIILTSAKHTSRPAEDLQLFMTLAPSIVDIRSYEFKMLYERGSGREPSRVSEPAEASPSKQGKRNGWDELKPTPPGGQTEDRFPIEIFAANFFARQKGIDDVALVECSVCDRIDFAPKEVQASELICHCRCSACDAVQAHTISTFIREQF